MFFRQKQTSVADVRDDFDQLFKDVRSLVSTKELDDIPEVRQLRRRIESRLSSAKETAQQAAQQTRDAAIYADKYAHDEPWRIATAALAVGLLVGFVACRR